MEKTNRELLEEIDELNSEIVSLKEEISDLQVDLSEVDDNSEDFEEAERRILELESEIESFKEYDICGEKVLIRVDNIAHETFFEKLEEFSKKCSIQELTNAMINLKSMSAR